MRDTFWRVWSSLIFGGFYGAGFCIISYWGGLDWSEKVLKEPQETILCAYLMLIPATLLFFILKPKKEG